MKGPRHYRKTKVPSSRTISQWVSLHPSVFPPVPLSCPSPPLPLLLPLSCSSSFLFLLSSFFHHRVSCSQGWLRTYSVAKNDLDPPIYSSQVPEWQAFATTPSLCSTGDLMCSTRNLWVLGKHSTNWPALSVLQVLCSNHYLLLLLLLEFLKRLDWRNQRLKIGRHVYSSSTITVQDSSQHGSAIFQTFLSDSQLGWCPTKLRFPQNVPEVCLVTQVCKALTNCSHYWRLTKQNSTHSKGSGKSCTRRQTKKTLRWTSKNLGLQSLLFLNRFRFLSVHSTSWIRLRPPHPVALNQALPGV